MRIKTLFNVPDGEKVTEKTLCKVLIASICSILLCMTCLVSTTWAWFSVSIENTGNVIQTADIPRYTLQVDGQTFASGEELLVGEHIINISHDSNADDLQKKSTLYVTFSIDEATYGYIIIGGEYPSSAEIKICNEKSCVLTWTASWFMPGNQDVKPLTDNVIQIIAEDSTEETTEASEPTEETSENSSETTEPIVEATETPTDTTAPTEGSTELPTEDTTGSATESTESTEAVTETANVPPTAGKTTEPAETTT